MPENSKKPATAPAGKPATTPARAGAGKTAASGKSSTESPSTESPSTESPSTAASGTEGATVEGHGEGPPESASEGSSPEGGPVGSPGPAPEESTPDGEAASEEAGEQTWLINPGTTPMVYDDEGRVIAAGTRIPVEGLDSTADTARGRGYLVVEKKSKGEGDPDAGTPGASTGD